MTDLRWDPNCRLCALGHDVLVLVGPGSREVVVAPTEHVATLGAVRDGRLGELLAALRRNAIVLGTDEGKVTIEPTKELVGTEGHLCMRVVPDPPDQPPSLFDDLDGLIRRLREILS